MPSCSSAPLMVDQPGTCRSDPFGSRPIGQERYEAEPSGQASGRTGAERRGGRSDHDSLHGASSRPCVPVAPAASTRRSLSFCLPLLGLRRNAEVHASQRAAVVVKRRTVRPSVSVRWRRSGAEHDLQRAPGADLAGQRDQRRPQRRRGRGLDDRLAREEGLRLARGLLVGERLAEDDVVDRGDVGLRLLGLTRRERLGAAATTTRATRSPPVKRTLTNESPFGPAGTATSKMTFPRVSKKASDAPAAVSTSLSTIPNAVVVASRGAGHRRSARRSGSSRRA